MQKANAVKSDFKAGVKIGKVFGGYFSDKKNINDFIKIGIKPFLSLFNKNIVFADFGGGDGYLAEGVKKYFLKNNKTVAAYNIDGNENYLKFAKKLKLETIIGY